MKLLDIHIDGFGVWSGLALRDLSPQCTVFYGPNEAGKTTLLEFIRAMWYGFSPHRRARYLPPLAADSTGARAGGLLSVCTVVEGKLQVRRHESQDQLLGSVSIEGPDGTMQGEVQLERLLHGIDETTYQNVFALGLRELQELGTLNDLEAARWLYALTAGLDRISLCDVLRELEHSRLRLWAGAGPNNSNERPSQWSELLQQRDRLEQEIDELSGQSHQYAQLFAQRATREQEITQLEQKTFTHEAEQRSLEIATLVYDTWQHRSALQTQIDSLGPQQQWPTDAIQRIDCLTTVIGKGKKRVRQLLGRRKSMVQQLAQITVNDSLWRQSARLAALAENEGWIASLQQGCRHAEDKAQALNAQRLSLLDQWRGTIATVPAMQPMTGSDSADLPKLLGQSAKKKLRRLAAHLLKAKRQANEARKKVEADRSVVQSANRELTAAVKTLGQGNLTAALESAGQRVAQLRRLIQLDEQIEKLKDTKANLEQSISQLMERQVLPGWILGALGGVFVLGVVLILAGLLLPASFIGSLGWPMAWLGLLGTGSAVAAKYLLDRSITNQLDESRKQYALVESQATQAFAEREQLDRALPRGAGSFVTRLESAQAELSRLESFLPLDSQRQASEQSAQQTERHYQDTRQHYHQARRDWRAALTNCKLPENLKPHQVRALLGAVGQLAVVEQQLREAEADVDRRQRELGVFSQRIEQVFLAANVVPVSIDLSQQLLQLRSALAEEESHHHRREALRRRQHRLRRRLLTVKSKVRRFVRRRMLLLKQCGVANLAEFRARATEFAKLASLITQRDSASREIAAVVGGSAQEATILALLTGKAHGKIESELAATRRRSEEVKALLRRLFEQRGELTEQIRLLGADRRLAVRRLELGQVQQQISQLAERWQALTITQRLLERIKNDYERHRQPETLREASGYMAKLTGGKYQRIWTRFGENALFVDDREGHPLPIEVLSHGTREQLFLSLRLALVSLFSRRGVNLPMVFDDVLVNFDNQRAMAAIEVLCDFASDGHQLLVFTCHEHVARLFKSRRVDVRRLPFCGSPGHDLPFENWQQPRRTRSKKVKEAEVVSERDQLSGPAEPECESPSEEPPQPAAGLSATLSVTTAQPSAILQTTIPVHLRVDSPQCVVRLSPVMRRAETTGDFDCFDSFPAFPRQSGRVRILREFAEQQTPIVIEPLPGEDDWEL